MYNVFIGNLSESHGYYNLVKYISVIDDYKAHDVLFQFLNLDLENFLESNTRVLLRIIISNLRLHFNSVVCLKRGVRADTGYWLNYAWSRESERCRCTLHYSCAGVLSLLLAGQNDCSTSEKSESAVILSIPPLFIQNPPPKPCCYRTKTHTRMPLCSSILSMCIVCDKIGFLCMTSSVIETFSSCPTTTDKVRVTHAPAHKDRHYAGMLCRMLLHINELLLRS